MDGFINFFYDQGVTSNVMKRAYMYRDKIPSDQTYILEFLHSGIFARLFGIRVYHGNTVEHALHGELYTCAGLHRDGRCVSVRKGGREAVILRNCIRISAMRASYWAMYSMLF